MAAPMPSWIWWEAGGAAVAHAAAAVKFVVTSDQKVRVCFLGRLRGKRAEVTCVWKRI